MAILYFKTGNSIAYTFEWTMALGIVQTLVSGIGVTLVIPCASFLSAKVLGVLKMSTISLLTLILMVLMILVGGKSGFTSFLSVVFNF